MRPAYMKALDTFASPNRVIISILHPRYMGLVKEAVSECARETWPSDRADDDHG